MEIVEFQTIVKNGTIEIPHEYQDKLKGHVHVILMSAPKESRRVVDFIDRLLAQPIREKSFRCLNREDIYVR